MNNDLPEKVKFGQWKRVPVEEKGRKKMVMKVVKTELDRKEFIEHMNKQIEEFSQHVNRVKRQYKEVHTLKENLKKDEAIIHMDFAENYACKTVEEIQSAYWNQTGVTLHPTVIYYKDSDGSFQHKRVVLISDELGHNSTTVLTFLDKIMKEVKLIIPQVKTIHYWTDSPTSQYRNKTIFETIANHEDKYQVKAVWNYFEAGHGKGPCDGLGGTTKHMADEAMKGGRVVIQDANDFYAWTQSSTCSMKKVKFVFVPSTECQEKGEELSKLAIKPIKGTMKVHAVVGRGNNTILVSDVSCYCNGCINGEYCNGHWTEETLREHITTSSSNETEKTSQAPVPVVSNGAQIMYNEGDYVAAIYNKMWYLGKIEDIDQEDGEIQVSFMQRTRQLYQWPKNEDIIWIAEGNIIRRINEPIPTGKSMRMFKIPKEDVESIESLFQMTLK